MNAPSNAEFQMGLGTQAVAPAVLSPTRPLYWSVRRELWEYRSIYVAPLAAAAIFLMGFAISLIHLPHKMRELSGLDPARQHQLISQPYSFAALLIMGSTFVVAFFYSLDALHGERRDRSILFWKSLPVSDVITVLSKASVPLVILPLLTFAISFVTQWIMFLMSAVVVSGSGLSVGALWSALSLGRMSVTLLYHLLAIHALWYAPFYCWLLLVSAWARRMAFLWAVIPVLVLNALEKVALNTSLISRVVVERIWGSAEGAEHMVGHMAHDPLATMAPGTFLSTPGLWIGLIFAAAFLAGAVRLRRYREPI
jgi:ABC-2 type transport system permease protein